MKLANEDVRRAMMASGLKQWEVAEALGLNEFYLSRKLRKELPPEEKSKILSVISERTSIDMDDKKELLALRAFKSYFDSLYETGLEVANWHYNGTTEPFDNFYDAAMEKYDAILG